MATNLTTENIKTISQFPEVTDLSPEDVILVQDVSENAYGKTTLQDVIDALSPAPTPEELFTMLAQKMFDSAHPVGETYVQYPAAIDMATNTVQYSNPEPMTLYNVNGVTSTWVELNYDGAFFRSNGGLAETFGSQSVEQKAELPNIVGGEMRVTGWGTDRRGALVSVRSGSGAPGASSGNGTDVSFNASYGQTNSDGTYLPKNKSVYKDGGEVRSANYTIRVWRRTA